LFEISGKNPGSGSPMRILAAILNRDGTAWFFKMTGNPGVVAEQKPALLEFLKSVQFGAPDAAALPAGHPPMDEMSLPPGHPAVSPMPAMPGTADGSVSSEGRPTWQVPPGWQEVPGGQFLVAKFNVSGAGDAHAAVNVSASAGDGGGLAGNVNRWRRQLGLPEQSEDEIARSVTTLETGAGQAAFVELSGTDIRTAQPVHVLGAMVSHGGQTWFYKLTGDAPVVGAQKDAFVKFVQSAQH
jgi:hypothetical protein